MTTRVFAFLTVAIFLSRSLLAAETKSLHFSCDFMEKYKDSSWQVVDTRSFNCKLGEPFQFSMGNFSYRLQATRVDPQSVRIESQLNAFDVKAHNYFDSKTLTRGASAFFDSVLVRGDSYYRVRLTFDSLGILRTDCGYRFSGDDFKSDPSGRFDIYFVKNSLGDFRWNVIRDALELDQKKWTERFNIKDQTKINYYVTPCQLPDVGWDPRWKDAIDMARNNLFAHFTHDANTLNPPVVYMMRFLRLWGYAPPFICEGISSTMEFCDFHARAARKNGKLPPLAGLINSRTFRGTDRSISGYAAGSFVSYAIVHWGMEKFQKWYQQATDLTVSTSFERIYGRKMADAEGDWLKYIDDLKFPPAVYFTNIERAQTFGKTDDVKLYAESYLQESGDTLWAGPILANIYYSAGDYGTAERIFRKMADVDSMKTDAQVYQANMLLTIGKVDQADSLYRLVAKSDTTNYYALQKIGQILFFRKDFVQAIDYVRKAAGKNKVPANGVDIDLLMGDIFSASSMPDSSRNHYQAALNNAKLLIGAFSENPLHSLRAGRAALKLGSSKLALDYLDNAYFLEDRIFYLGQIFLARGQAHDLLKERAAAKEEYRKIVDLPTSARDKEEARQYLTTPYHN